MTSSNRKKTIQLGMPHGTANAKLRKAIMFKLLKETDLNWCYQCNKKIVNINELSIEHKIPWLDSDNPKELFFDLDNIAFSHLVCNVGNRRGEKGVKHPSLESYRRGCRCAECKEIKSASQKEYIKKRNKNE